MTKPVDLIVANVMHEAVDQMAIIDRVTDAARKAFPDAALQFDGNAHEIIARMLLRRIADDAPMASIYASLSASGAPGSLDLVKEGLQAVKDRRS